MPNLIKIKSSELHVGVPSTCSFYDAQGRLVLEKGGATQDPQKIQRWMEIGLYRKEDQRTSHSNIEERIVDPYDPFYAINSIQNLLKSCYGKIVSGCGDCQGCKTGLFQKRLDSIAKDIIELVQKEPDLALGFIALCEDHEYIIRHPIKQAIICEILGDRLEIAQQRRYPMIQAALTGNISMIGIQQTLIDQQGRPSEAQWTQIMEHPVQSVEFLKQAEITDELLLQFVMQHHEKENGTGYPNKIMGEEIALESAIIAIADKYCAMLASRSYKTRSHGKDVLTDFLVSKDKEHNEVLVLSLIKEVTVFPPGTTVLLASGEIGVVIKRTQNPMHPVISAVKNERGDLYVKAIRRDSSNPKFAIREVQPAGALGKLENRLWFLWDS